MRPADELWRPPVHLKGGAGTVLQSRYFLLAYGSVEALHRTKRDALGFRAQIESRASGVIVSLIAARTATRNFVQFTPSRR